jgi:hypothetical protein
MPDDGEGTLSAEPRCQQCEPGADDGHAVTSNLTGSTSINGWAGGWYRVEQGTAARHRPAVSRHRPPVPRYRLACDTDSSASATPGRLPRGHRHGLPLAKDAVAVGPAPSGPARTSVPRGPRAIAEEADLRYVEDRCPKLEHARPLRRTLAAGAAN